MGEFVKGEVVSIPFPFSNLEGTKKRPAIVLSETMGEDIILCQVTASRHDEYSVELQAGDFADGSLPRQSYIRPNKLFTLDYSMILEKKGTLNPSKYQQVVQAVLDIIS